MNHITLPMLVDAVAAQGAVFDSHAIIRWLMTNYPQEYVRDLFECVASDDPIQTAHAQFGLALHEVPGIRPDSKVKSMNVRGQVTENQQWRKKQP